MVTVVDERWRSGRLVEESRLLKETFSSFRAPHDSLSRYSSAAQYSKCLLDIIFALFACRPICLLDD